MVIIEGLIYICCVGVLLLIPMRYIERRLEKSRRKHD